MKRAKRSSRATCEPDDPAHRSRADAPVPDEALKRAAALFRAIGDLARLRLLERLAAGESCVTELADAAQVGLSTVSQQLRVLRQVNLVSRRRLGKHIYYSLADEHVMEFVANALAHASEERATMDDSEDDDEA
jgi:DNA-binding transcriptional ArsR family regulator